jgi:hypothetical protein
MQINKERLWKYKVVHPTIITASQQAGSRTQKNMQPSARSMIPSEFKKSLQ